VAVRGAKEGEGVVAGRCEGRVGVLICGHGVDELILSAGLMLMGGGGGSPAPVRGVRGWRIFG
jgi:hypothetical protein